MCAECVQRSLLSVIRDFLIRNDQYLQRYVEVAYLEYRTVSDVHNVSQSVSQSITFHIDITVTV